MFVVLMMFLILLCAVASKTFAGQTVRLVCAFERGREPSHARFFRDHVTQIRLASLNYYDTPKNTPKTMVTIKWWG